MAKQKPSASARRSAARLAAVQALYQREMTAIGTEQVLGEFARFRFGAELNGQPLVEPDRALFAAIVRGVGRRRAEVDAMVKGALGPQWSFDRLEILLRTILRAGVWEMLEHRSAETGVVVAEYIDLTDAFFVGREAAMVNAVLDKVGHTVRDEDGPAEAPEGDSPRGEGRPAVDAVTPGRAARTHD